MADALMTLARLRRFEAEEARRALGEAVTREIRAQQQADRARDERRREAAAAPTGIALAGAYAAWLPRSARDIAAAEAEVARQAESRIAAIAALVDCRAAVQATQILIDERIRLTRRRAGRQAQARLDEAGRHAVGD